MGSIIPYITQPTRFFFIAQVTIVSTEMGSTLRYLRKFLGTPVGPSLPLHVLQAAKKKKTGTWVRSIEIVVG